MFAMRWRRNVLSIVNPGRYRFFEGVDGASQRFVSIIAEGRELREVGRCGHYGPVVVFERNRIGKHQVNPRSFLISAMSLAPGSLREFCKYIARADSSRAGPQFGGEFADADRFQRFRDRVAVVSGVYDEGARRFKVRAGEVEAAPDPGG